MIQTIRKAWGIPELRRKIIFTLLILLIFRIGNAITEEEAGRLIGQLAGQAVITPQEADIMRAAVSGQTMAIPVPDQMKDALRARCLKNMLTAVARQNRALPG